MFSPVIRHLLHVPDTEQECLYLESCLTKVEQRETFFMCVFDNRSEQLIGALEIRDIRHHPGQLYSWINEQFWGGGRYQEAMRLASAIYFDSMPDSFFTAHVDVGNPRSYRALRKCGFAPWRLHNGPYGMQHVLVCRRRDIVH
jgi:RimJ/RimL family protein N-acetyltransferase